MQLNSVISSLWQRKNINNPQPERRKAAYTFEQKTCYFIFWRKERKKQKQKTFFEKNSKWNGAIICPRLSLKKQLNENLMEPMETYPAVNNVFWYTLS